MSKFSSIVVRNSSIGLAAQIMIKLLSFVFTIMVVRHLGAEQYGQYTAVLAFGAVFVFLADLGLSPYAVRAVARLRDQPASKAKIESLYTDLLQLRFLQALLTALLIISTAWYTNRPLPMIIGIALGTLGLLMYSVQGSGEAVLAGYERLDIAAGAHVIHQLVFVVVGSAVFLVGTGYYGLIFANLLGILLMTLICWHAVRILGVRTAKSQPKLWPQLIRSSIPFGIIGFTLGLSYKFDSILLNVFYGDGPTGYYNAAYTLVFAAVMLSNTINTALYPSLARQAVADASTLPALYQRLLRYLLALSLPITVGTFLLADQFVPLLFGSDYAPAIAVLRTIIWVLPLMYTSEFLGYIVVIAGQEVRVAHAVVASTTVNVIANLYLIPRYGVQAAAMMTVVTEAVLVLQYLWLLRHEFLASQWAHALLRPTGAVAVMGGITLLLRAHLPLFFTVGTSALSYFCLLFIFGVVGRSELLFIRHLRQGIVARPSEI